MPEWFPKKKTAQRAKRVIPELGAPATGQTGRDSAMNRPVLPLTSVRFR